LDVLATNRNRVRSALQSSDRQSHPYQQRRDSPSQRRSSRNVWLISLAGRRSWVSIAPLGSIGNLGRNVYRTDSFSSVDFRLTRKIPLSGVVLNISTDVFNLFNRVNMRKADTAFTQSGRPVSAFNARQIQFGLRLTF
jgi:hypothetical protein